MTKDMTVTIIGSGNVATVMGRVLLQKGYTIDEVYSRDLSHASSLADELHAKAIDDLQAISKQSDIYIIAVSDDVVKDITDQLSLNDHLVIHTAGSLSKEVLKNMSTQYGVLWPAKMIRKQMQSLEPVTIVVDGNNEMVTKKIEQIASVFSDNIVQMGDEQREKLHMLAAFTSNFSNHLYQLAADYCAAESIDFSLLYPIIEETARRIQIDHPRNAQAGPAFRNDSQTIAKHLYLLENHPQARHLYEELTRSILQSFHP